MLLSSSKFAAFSPWQVCLMLWMIHFALRQCFTLSCLTPGCSNASALEKDSYLIYSVLFPCAVKLQSHNFPSQLMCCSLLAHVQFPRPGSCWPQSPSQWGLEQLSRGVQRGQCWLWSRVPAGVWNKRENSPSLILPLPPNPAIQPVSSKSFCGVCRSQSFFFFLLTLLLHSIRCLFSCAASCLLHLNTLRVSLWVFWQVAAVRGSLGRSCPSFCSRTLAELCCCLGWALGTEGPDTAMGHRSWWRTGCLMAERGTWPFFLLLTARNETGSTLLLRQSKLVCSSYGLRVAKMKIFRHWDNCSWITHHSEKQIKPSAHACCYCLLIN